MNGLIEITDDDVFIVDMMYARPDNMVQRAVYQEVGLGSQCLVHLDVKKNLEKLRPELKKLGLKLKICDAYRPPLAHQMMREIIPMEGFFAVSPELSQHCHASAVDVILTDRKGNELEFPCLVDAYDKSFAEKLIQGNLEGFSKHLEKANYKYKNCTKEAADNRNLMRQLMEQAGFVALLHEWWHFNLPNKENYPLIEFIL